MGKLDDALVLDLKDKIRDLSREAAIQILLGMVESLRKAVSIKASDIPEYVEEGKKLTEIYSRRGVGL